MLCRLRILCSCEACEMWRQLKLYYFIFEARPIKGLGDRSIRLVWCLLARMMAISAYVRVTALPVPVWAKAVLPSVVYVVEFKVCLESV